MHAPNALRRLGRLMILAISLMMPASLQATQQVSLVVDGAAVPYLVSPGGTASGMNGVGTSIQANIMGSEVDSSDAYVGIRLTDPVAGIYNLSLAGPYAETIGLSFGFYDAVTDEQYTRSYQALYHGGTLGMTLLIDPDQSPALELQSTAGDPVIATVSLSNSGTVVLNWPASTTGNVVKYRVYRRMVSMPVFEQVAELTTLSFDTGDQLRSTSGDKILYTVVAVTAAGEESLVDQVVENNISANAAFQADNTVIIAPATVQFTDFSFGEPDQWAWDFDSDGVTDSTAQNPTHTFDAPGKYTITLSIDGPYGQDTQTVTNYIAAYTDNDTDGIPDGIDSCPGNTKPAQVSTENDGLGDACDSDDDNDDLTDVDELALGTDPLLADTDGDGYSDGLEVTVGTDPLNNQHTFFDVAGDINGDGQINAGDLALGANILLGVYTPTPSEQARFDIAPLSDGLPLPDGNNNVGDYLILLRLVSGSIHSWKPIHLNTAKIDSPSSFIKTTKEVPIDPPPRPPPPPIVQFPIDLTGTAPEEVSLEFNAPKPNDVTDAQILIEVFDADFPDEGQLIINGNPPINLFGTQGNAKHDGVSEKLSFASPASYWKNGKNIVIFKHTKSQGFTVENLEVAFSSTPPPPPPVLTGIKPYKNNNSYWEYEGKPILLIGGFSQTSQPFLQTKSDLIKELDATKANGGNYIRNTMAVFKKTKIQNVSPFVRLGNGKFDLDQINNAYYDYLRVLFEEAHKRQIIVQLELWDPWYFYGNAWVTSPWAPSNNINYSSADTGIPDTFTAKPYTEVNKIYYSIKDANKASVLKYQEAFVKKVLEVAKPFDNIIYQIENEEMKKVQPLSNDWADYWANFIKDNAGKTAYVTHMPADYDLLTSAKQDHVLKKTSLYGFLDISQGGMGLTNQKRYELILKYVNKVKSGPKVRPVNSTKIYKSRSSTFSETSDGIAINRMWHNVFAGVAAVRFHRPGAGIDTPSVALRQTKSMRYFANSLDITKMIPNNGILSKRSSDEAYAMSEKKGKTHAVYFTGSSDRSVNINLNSASGNLQLTWYNTQTGETKSGGTISGGGTLTLTTPSSNSWVAILK